MAASLDGVSLLLHAWPRFLDSCIGPFKTQDSAGTFEVTLEATHHGPWHMHPTMFVEIGSKEEDWGREDAAHVWADVLEKNLGLSATEANGVRIPAVEESKLVIVGAGGGALHP